MTHPPNGPSGSTSDERSHRTRLARLLALTVFALAVLILILMAGGSGSRTATLMPTPLVFTELGIGPVDHVPPEGRFPPRRVYYATTRKRRGGPRRIDYGNGVADRVAVGLALVGFGSPTLSWTELGLLSSRSERENTVPLSLNGVVEAGQFEEPMSPDEAAAETRAGWWMSEVADSIRDARDPDLLVYVHGTKVDFTNGCEFAAQLDHFMGRDMTSLAFCWPSHQNILAYGLGPDVRRAEQSAPALATLLDLLAARAGARRIHIVAWSAGARVLTGALTELRKRHASEDGDTLRARLGIRTAYFVAGDMPRDRFLDALPAITDVCERVIVSASSADSALISAERFMGGDTRIGQASGSVDDAAIALLEGLEGIEVLNVSLDSDERGFDITGHNYWFDNPWASSDVILATRTDLGPAERGLARGDRPFMWYLPPDYPSRLRELGPDSLVRAPLTEGPGRR